MTTIEREFFVYVSVEADALEKSAEASRFDRNGFRDWAQALERAANDVYAALPQSLWGYGSEPLREFLDKHPEHRSSLRLNLARSAAVALAAYEAIARTQEDPR